MTAGSEYMTRAEAEDVKIEYFLGYPLVVGKRADSVIMEGVI